MGKNMYVQYIFLYVRNGIFFWVTYFHQRVKKFERDAFSKIKIINCRKKAV